MIVSVRDNNRGQPRRVCNGSCSLQLPYPLRNYPLPCVSASSIAQKTILCMFVLFFVIQEIIA